jgi:hypothetical protein
MNKSAREKEAVLNVFASLVRPFTRVAFEYGISASEIAGVVRRTYIQALEARLQEQKRATTDTRLAVVAGLTKSEVTALREATRAGAPHSLKATVSLDQITNLLTVWHTHSGFSGAYGLALELDLAAVPGSPRRNFRELIAAACPGADDEALLDELVAAGSVEVIDGLTVRCLSRAFVPKGADVERIELAGRFLAGVTGSIVHNLTREEPEPLYFERAVVSDELMTETARDRFLALASERSQELLTELDTFLARDVDKAETGKRYGVGIYFFEAQSANNTESRAPRGSEDGKHGRDDAPVEIDVLAGLDRQKK